MTYPGYQKIELRQLQMLQLRVMKLIHAICVEKGVNYYLIAGSLLGAVRHKGFIPWDDDIDIAMMRDDFEKFKKEFSKSFPQDKYFLQTFSTDPNFDVPLARLCVKNTIQDIPSDRFLKSFKGTYIDIFPLDNVPNSNKLRLKQEKQISKIRLLFRLKLYRVYESNSVFSVIAKKTISALLTVIPLAYLQKKYNEVLLKYDGIKSSDVCSMASKYNYCKQAMPKSIYGTPTLIRFEDTEFFGPEYPIAYLKKLYGENYMQLPPMEKREIPHDVYVKEGYEFD